MAPRHVALLHLAGIDQKIDVHPPTTATHLLPHPVYPLNTSGVALSLFAFGSSTYTCAVLGVFSYAAMAIDRKRCGYVVFAGSFAYLIYFHAFSASGAAT